jgi:hypothetical protein
MSEPHPLPTSFCQAAAAKCRCFLPVTTILVGVFITACSRPATPPAAGPVARGGDSHLLSAVSPNSERRALAFAFTSAPGFLISASPFSRISAFSGLTALTLETMES